MDRHPRILPPIWLAIAGLLVAASPPAADPVEKARGLSRSGDFAEASAILEAALPAAPAARRAAIVAELRKSYEGAIRKAESSGNKAEAEKFRDNLEILSRKPRAPKIPDAIASKPDPTSPEPLPITEMADAPATPSETKPRRPEPRDPSGDPPSQADPIAPSTPEPRESAPPVELPNRDDSVARAGLIKTANASTRPAEPEPQPEPKAPEARPAPEPKDDLASADEAFRDRRFDEAGKLYAALAKAGSLPEIRRDAWAYCRCHEVVRQINAGPATPQAWAAVRGEIEQIRKLSPQLWYAEYLRSLAAERSGAKAANPKQARKPILRGASPEEPTPAPKPAPRANAGAGQDRIGRPGATENGWQVWETNNFRILHLDEILAEKVARVVEASRDAHFRRWTGSAPPSSWTPVCDVYLYPTAAQFQKATGQGEGSPGFSTMGMNSGRVTDRRITLRADNPRLLTAVLPHEVTHVVLADLFPTSQIPRWADEGISVLSEPQADQRLRDEELSEPLARGRAFHVQNLMVMDYPEGERWGVYYAQSVSLTRFLVERGTAPKFIKFVQDSRQNGIEAELKRSYGIDGVADLHRQWLEYARSRSTSLASSGGESKAR